MCTLRCEELSAGKTIFRARFDRSIQSIVEHLLDAAQRGIKPQLQTEKNARQMM